jgi:hypothetical protein
MTSSLLSEGFFPIPQDNTYRRQGRDILIATMESVTPLESTLDPSIWGGGTPDFTWGRVQRFFSRSPLARHGQMPMHYYAEYLRDDYVAYVGCPLTNRSWFLQAAVAAGVLPVRFVDAVLVVLQENYGIETVEKRMWAVLSNSVLTPVMRMEGIPRDRVGFFELAADPALAEGVDWPFRFRGARYADPVLLELFLKDFEKR